MAKSEKRKIIDNATLVGKFFPDFYRSIARFKLHRMFGCIRRSMAKSVRLVEGVIETILLTVSDKFLDGVFCL